MSSRLSGYVKNIINKGDEGSDILRKIAAETLEYNQQVDIVGHKTPLAVIKAESNDAIVVHSAGGDPDKENVGEHARSMVNNLLNQAEKIEATPIGFANVIDSYDGSREMLEQIGRVLADTAKGSNLAIMNGENAILGPRINPYYKANLTGTMISTINVNRLKEMKIEWEEKDEVVNFEDGGVTYSAFSHLGQPVFINSDGVGTKTEFYERFGLYKYAVQDFMAMNLDDAIKLGATPKVVSGIVETRGKIPLEDIVSHAEKVVPENISVTLQEEKVGERLTGYSMAKAAYNISGSVVSLICEDMLDNPPAPHEGDHVISLMKRQNPRSNGISARRSFMKEKYGLEWQTREGTESHRDYLTTPSEILYGTFSKMLDKGLATSFYHMSGGAFKGKLSRPIAEEGLFAKIDGLFEPHEVDIEMMEGIDGDTVRAAYETWPMGNDGFITTDKPGSAISFLENLGYMARKVGVLERRRGVSGAYIQTPFNIDVDFTEKSS